MLAFIIVVTLITLVLPFLPSYHMEHNSTKTSNSTWKGHIKHKQYEHRRATMRYAQAVRAYQQKPTPQNIQLERERKLDMIIAKLDYRGWYDEPYYHTTS